MHINRSINLTKPHSPIVAGALPPVPAAPANNPAPTPPKAPIVVQGPSAQQSQRDLDNMVTGGLFFGGIALAVALPVAWPVAALMAAAGGLATVINNWGGKAEPEPARSVPVEVKKPEAAAPAETPECPSPAEVQKARIFALMTEVWDTDAYCNEQSYKWWRGQLKLVNGDMDQLREVMMAYKKSIERS